jgi:hypothetical protein
MITIHFERVGRTHDVPDLTIDPEEVDINDAEPFIAFMVRMHARRYLMSRDISAAVSKDTKRVFIYAGMNNGGGGTIDYGNLAAWWSKGGYLHLRGTGVVPDERAAQAGGPEGQ